MRSTASGRFASRGRSRGWFIGGKRVAVKIDDGRLGVGGRRALKRVGQRFEPGGIDGLQREQLGDSIARTLRSAVAISGR